jgi:hypothetical protein
VSSPSTNGSILMPELVADTPSTYCKNVGRNVNAPSIANPTMKASVRQTENTERLNRRIGKIGSAARRSTTTKMSNATAPSTNSPRICAEIHG